MANTDLTSPPRVMPFGPRAFLINGGSQTQRLAWAKTMEALRPHGFSEWIMGYDSLLLKFGQMTHASKILALLEDSEQDSAAQGSIRHHELAIDYSGPDLDAVAEHCALTTREVIEQHSAADYSVRFLGFSPGFAYLDGLPEHLACPRRDSPRKRMTPGSLAIGGSHTGIYPTASPGGWNWIGQCHEILIDPSSKTAPFRLLPGDTVKFIPS